MPYKLTYFNARGLCEPIRMIFEVAGEKYEDFRVPMDSPPAVIPPEIKQDCRWGQLPILEVDGKILAQSHAIGRFLAKKYGLTGETDFESACCDEYCDTVREMMQAWLPAFMEQDPKKKSELYEATKAKMDSEYLAKFEGFLALSGSGWLVGGGGMSWADISLAHYINNVETVMEQPYRDHVAEKFPNVGDLYQGVFSHPRIKSWVSRRPKTKF